MDETNQDKSPAEKTVKELRELAKEIPGVSGIHAMKKDELLALLTGGGGSAATAAEAPKPAKAAGKAKGAAKKVGGKKVKEMSRVEIKGRLKELRKDKEAVQAAGKRQVAILRRRVNRLKKRSRREIAAA